MVIAPVRDLALRGRGDKITLWNLADIHLGTANCDEELLARVIAAIRADPQAYWIGLGDYMECISPQDIRRFDPRSLAPWILADKEAMRCPIEEQKVKCWQYLRPIAGKCLGIVAGNHEDDAARYYAQSTAAWLAGQMKAPYLDCLGAVPIRVSRKGSGAHLLCNVVATHGHSGAATSGGRVNMLQRLLDNYEGIHLLFAGHLHHADTISNERIGLKHDGSDTRACRSVAIMSGAFYRGYLKGVPSYPERRGYKASVLGPMAAEITMREKSHGGIEYVYVKPTQPDY